MVALPSVCVFWPTGLLSGPMPKLGEVTHQLIATHERLCVCVCVRSDSLCTEKLEDHTAPLGKIFMEKYPCLISLNREVELQQKRVLHPHYNVTLGLLPGSRWVRSSVGAPHSTEILQLELFFVFVIWHYSPQKWLQEGIRPRCSLG